MDDINQALADRTPRITHEPGCEVNTDATREWWAARGVDYAGIEEWCIKEASSDIAAGGTVEIAVSLIGGKGGVGACLATAYELGLMAGVALAETLADA